LNSFNLSYDEAFHTRDRSCDTKKFICRNRIEGMLLVSLIFLNKLASWLCSRFRSCEKHCNEGLVRTTGRFGL